jgi:hypothetical protein
MLWHRCTGSGQAGAMRCHAAMRLRNQVRWRLAYCRDASLAAATAWGMLHSPRRCAASSGAPMARVQGAPVCQHLLAAHRVAARRAGDAKQVELLLVVGRLVPRLEDVGGPGGELRKIGRAHV